MRLANVRFRPSRLPRAEDFGIYFLRGADVGIAACNVAFELPRLATPVKRCSVIWDEPHRLVEVSDGGFSACLR
jgi:hypothetical protein